jgi:hypothetical protein
MVDILSKRNRVPQSQKQARSEPVTGKGKRTNIVSRSDLARKPMIIIRRYNDEPKT